MSKRRHHYNPQFYLRGFTESKASPYLWRYEKSHDSKTVRVNIKNAGVKRDYYAYTRVDGTKDLDSVEDALNEVFEIPGNPILNKLRSRYFDLNLEERIKFSNYLSITITRVPRNRQRIEKKAPEVVDTLLDKFPSRLALYKQFFEISHDDEVEVLEYVQSWQDAPPDFLFLPMFLGRISRAIALMNWYFIYPAPGHNFISTDNPVVFTERSGFNSPDSELIFSISKNIALLATRKIVDWPIPYLADKELTEEINSSFVGGAVQYIYSCCSDDWIKNLIEEMLIPETK